MGWNVAPRRLGEHPRVVGVAATAPGQRGWWCGGPGQQRHPSVGAKAGLTQVLPGPTDSRRADVPVAQEPVDLGSLPETQPPGRARFTKKKKLSLYSGVDSKTGPGAADDPCCQPGWGSRARSVTIRGSVGENNNFYWESWGLGALSDH